MFADYEDIRSRISEEPAWFDTNGVPRYGAFSPDMLPDIYARQAALIRIGCQSCRKTFLVGVSSGAMDRTSVEDEVKNGSIGIGDPPRHDCSGDTMMSDSLKVIEFWKRENFGWSRMPELEVPLPDSGAC